MVIIRNEISSDIAARERLLDRCFGPGRFRKTSEKFRRRRLPAAGLALSAEIDGQLVGTVRLWSVDAGGGCPALLLGPLAVNPNFQGEGIGAHLMHHAIETARALGHGAILLVGDEPYYRRFGFLNALTAELRLPGPYEKHRFLGLELVSGALSGAKGMVLATGMLKSKAGMPLPAIANGARAA